MRIFLTTLYQGQVLPRLIVCIGSDVTTVRFCFRRALLLKAIGRAEYGGFGATRYLDRQRANPTRFEQSLYDNPGFESGTCQQDA
jgi:hypothetical protein